MRAGRTVTRRPATTAAARSARRVAGSAPSRRAAHPVVSVRTRAAVAVEEVDVAEEDVGSVDGETVKKDNIRNIAIIAHVDHGKTTLVDALLSQTQSLERGQEGVDRIMDSDNIERERGITILSKNASIQYKGKKVNIIDTPGHADFGGEVERVLRMTDGVLLVVDSVEGPMPQTRFVLKKSLELGLRVVVVVNKVDRPAARAEYAVDKTFELFCNLGASDEQCDFPVVYASGIAGKAGLDGPDELEDTLTPLLDTIVDFVPPPVVDQEGPLRMLVSNIDYDQHKGRIAVGRVYTGSVRKGQWAVTKPEQDKRSAKVAEVFTYRNMGREVVDEVRAGDICALSGISDISIGETICCAQAPGALPTIEVEKPTVRMKFLVNTSPFAGQEGEFVTSRNLKDRLDRELERNLALSVEPGAGADEFIVSGRGTLHITILIENMRREGFEFQIGPPTVILKEDEEGRKLEPYEEATVECPTEFTGACVDLLGSRAGQMLDMQANDVAGTTTIKYRVPTRGLIGLRNAMLTASKGNAVLNTIFDGYGEWSGDLNTRANGSLVAHETGQTTQYALKDIQERGTLFMGQGEKIYKGQVIGIHQRFGDLVVNAAKAKKATNVRSNAEIKVPLASPKELSLDDCIEYIASDELVEVTPENVRMRKVETKNMRGVKKGAMP